MKHEDQMASLELPLSFYKYKSIDEEHLEHTSRIFTHNELYFSSVTAFNDPFDGKCQMAWVGSDSQRRHYRTNLLKDYAPSLNRRGRRTKVSKDKKMLDSPEFQKQFQNSVRRTVEKFGICCLSRVLNSILMWAHYARAHSGFCLQLLDEPSDRFYVELKAGGRRQNRVRLAPMQVDYDENYPVVNRLHDDPNKSAKKMIFTKAKSWAYEEEWRMVDEDGTRSHQFPSRFLTGVIFGLRMTDEHKALIRGWCKDRRPAMKYYEARQSEDSYSLKIVEIS